MSTLPSGAVPWVHDLARWIASWVHRPFYRIRVRERLRVPAEGPVVMVANHSSFIEPQLLFGLTGRRAVFLVKSELSRGPAGHAFRWIGQIMVRRGVADREPLMKAVSVLKAGGLIGVFPEGTRGAGDVSHAEQGAAWLVRMTGAVVLPVATRGTRERRGFRPKLDILVGEPIGLNVQPGRTGLAAATEEIRKHLAALVRELDELRK
ncbi:lysophospholipid acyltransferase family protein [Actinophytocola oryzae]|uniref:1-acyl-sn-glycerol-3-phosphate acyltransferase n=1 Tax=Actinophytocola oryzae TaxID=502181 RepID=A0A4R7US45_9PSEU|nr:lysophospholipid acyltransferase family protein [Actinophytocola oryzae]TDV36677.1 1-acyl-sn-glycerol-3-phosphate acyltransferase [Actinophytocola oryzae]